MIRVKNDMLREGKKYNFFKGGRGNFNPNQNGLIQRVLEFVNKIAPKCLKCQQILKNTYANFKNFIYILNLILIQRKRLST
jgi:hypothetical protein